MCVCGGIGSDSGIYTVVWWKREQDGNEKKIKSTNIPIFVPDKDSLHLEISPFVHVMVKILFHKSNDI